MPFKFDTGGLSTVRPDFGFIHSYESFGAVDGPGVRFVVFLQGCPLRCLYCHNPDTWNMQDGKRVSADDVIREILPYRNFIRGGVTLSGGEPLLQPSFCTALLSACKQEGFHTAIDTAGSIPLAACRDAVDAADLILLDIKDIDQADCIALTGQDHQNAFTLLQYCERVKKPVWIRHVLVPGLTLKEEKLHRLAQALQPFSCIEKVELNPFHKMGEYKWQLTSTPYLLKETAAPSETSVRHAKEVFRSYALPI